MEVGAAGGECECLNFADLYESGQAKCGQGLELTRVTFEPMTMMDFGKRFQQECFPRALEKSILGQLTDVWSLTHQEDNCTWAKLVETDVEDCGDFPMIPNSSWFKHQRHNYCIKAVQYAPAGSAFHSTSWCYVSSKCTGLGQGARINDQVSWKTCEEGQDRFLRDLDVPELCGLLGELDPKGKLLGACQLAVYKAYEMGAGVWQKSFLEDEQLLASLKRTTYWKDPANDAAVVFSGNKVYEVYGDLRNWTDFKCVKGC